MNVNGIPAGARIRVALLGCGRISKNHFDALAKLPGLELVAVCAAEGVALLPWSPLKGGWLAGKHSRDAPAPGSRVESSEKTGVVLQSHPNFSAKAADELTWRVLDALRDIAAATGATQSQVALGWLLAKKVVASVVVGAKNVEQLKDNLAGKALSAEHVATLDTASALPKPYPYEMIARVNLSRQR